MPFKRKTHSGLLALCTAGAWRRGGWLLASVLAAALGGLTLARESPQATGTITGTILDFLGRPVAAATVVASAATSHTATTGEDGRFLLTGVRPGKYALLIGPPPDSDLVGDQFVTGSLKDALTVQVEAGKVARVKRTLGRGGRLEIDVMRGAVPIARAELVPPEVTIGGGAYYSPEPQFLGGRFTYTGLAPRSDYWVTLVVDGFATQRKAGVAIVAGAATRIVFNLDPENTTGVAGVLRQANGEPIPGVSVYAVNLASQAVDGDSKTNAAGVFRILGLEQGRYRLGALGAPNLATVEIVPSRTSHVVLIWPGAS